MRSDDGCVLTVSSHANIANQLEESEPDDGQSSKTKAKNVDDDGDAVIDDPFDADDHEAGGVDEPESKRAWVDRDLGAIDRAPSQM